MNYFTFKQELAKLGIPLGSFGNMLHLGDATVYQWGNKKQIPLYVEKILKMLEETGAILKVDQQWDFDFTMEEFDKILSFLNIPSRNQFAKRSGIPSITVKSWATREVPPYAYLVLLLLAIKEGSLPKKSSVDDLKKALTPKKENDTSGR